MTRCTWAMPQSMTPDQTMYRHSMAECTDAFSASMAEQFQFQSNTLSLHPLITEPSILVLYPSILRIIVESLSIII